MKASEQEISREGAMIHVRTLKAGLPRLPAACLAGLALLVPTALQAVTPEILARDLEHPWALAFINEGRMLVTERAGRMRVVEADGRLGAPLQGLPEIDAGGQGGLLDVIVDSRFARNRTLYFCFSEPGANGNSTALGAARLSEDLRQLDQVRILFSQRPKVTSRQHFGCRIVEHGDGTLFLTLGDRFGRMADAQKLDNHIGKVVRINKDGSVPQDNPFLGKRGALAEIWSYGHRNSQGATLGPDGRVWMHEHGPQGGDEINVLEAGKNYGWPEVSHGVHYGGGKVGTGKANKDGFEPPLHHWTPSIAPSGMAFLNSERYGAAWRGNLFVGALAGRHLARLHLEGGKVMAEEKLLRDFGQRIRDVRLGPDGLLYLLTDERRGQLVRLRPQPD
jgi:aldose sugar dehydrogenase